MSEHVQVRAVEAHADRHAPTHWRHAGERYRCTPGVARRRERHGVVEIIDAEEQSEVAQDRSDGEGPDVEIIGPTTEPELSIRMEHDR